MAQKAEFAASHHAHDPFALLRQLAIELDRGFDDPYWAAFRWPALRASSVHDGVSWTPKVDVFEQDGRFVIQVDLPGVQKENVTIGVSNGDLVVSGQRQRKAGESSDSIYRTERDAGHFWRAVPLPEGVRLEDVTATCADGVLEISVPLPAGNVSTVRNIQIGERATETAAPQGRPS